ncbi:tonB-system energizer ExbB [Parasphingorhabdus flavimaris]|uniref:tonB-system energizer ExbB n=1 Tax=Parasphingorhabdus flavimaris TaxID=266812 RepID=UPI003002E9E9
MKIEFEKCAIGVIACFAFIAPASAMAAPALATIPVELSVAGMFAQADWIVKLVIVGLAFASLASWTIFIAKTLELRAATAKAREAHDGAIVLKSLDDANGVAALNGNALVTEASTELALSSDALNDGEGVKERIVSRFERYEAALARRLTRGVNILATIGATAPFVGLFGTVWGIMNSFIGIAEKQTTNLAVVAPGIAEALLATALGLVAAIPAVIMYNHFSRQISAHRALVSDTAAAILRLVSRDLSRGVASGKREAGKKD